MTWLPVVERELRVASRRAATYRVRFWAALIMLIFLGWNLLEGGNGRSNSSQVGRELFIPLSFAAFLFASLIGVIATSDSVSEEKREGTLGLLFLTDLKGYDVILGKLAAHSLNAFYSLVAILPILGIPLLMGGVTLAQFVKLIVALVSAIVVSLAGGVFVSTHSRSERKAMFFTLLLVAAVTCVPFLLMIWLDNGLGLINDKQLWMGLIFSPGFAVIMALGPPSIFPISSYWSCVALSWASAVGLLWSAARTAPRSWTERPPKPVREKAPGRKHSTGMKSRRKLLEDNPFLWLALRGEASAARVWLFVLSIFVMWLGACFEYGSIAWSYEVTLPTTFILHLGLKIWASGEASRRFVEDRRNNAMEFLLSTPLNEREIIRGQWRALMHQFLGPVIAVLLWEMVIAFAMSHAKDWGYLHPENKTPELLISMFFLPMDIATLGWAGMWFGMTSKGRGRAMLTGLGLVVVLPWALSKLFMAMGENIGSMGAVKTTGQLLQIKYLESVRNLTFACSSLFVTLPLIIWTRRRLLTNFRRLAVAG